MRAHARGVAAVALVLWVGLVAAGPAAAQDGLRDDPLSAELRAWVQESGPIRVAYATSTRPVVEVDDDGTITGGYMVDLVDLAALKVGADVERVAYPTIADAVAALRAGEVDVAGGMAERPDLASFATMTTPFAWTPLVAVVAATSDAASADDLAGGTVTTIPGSPIEQALRAGAEVAGLRDVTYVPQPSLPAALGAARDGQVDAFVGPLAIVGVQTRDEPSSVRIVATETERVRTGVWGDPASPAWQVLEAGRNEITDEELAVTHVRWTGFDLTLPEDGPPAWLVPVGLSLLGLLALSVAFSLALRRQVARRTAALRALHDDLERRVRARTADLAAANVQLERSNRALDEFALVTAHDLRGPMTALAGFSELLAGDRLPESRRGEVAERIAVVTRNLASMVEGLLLRARGDAAPGGTVVDVDEFVGWIADTVSLEMDAAGVTLDVTSRVDQLDVDEALLTTIVVNLVGNAAKHAAVDGRARVELVLDQSDGVVRLTCEDDGPGIAPVDRARVLEDGVQLDEDRAGVGLGLAVLARTVEHLGGALEVGQARMGGAAITVELPARTRTAPARGDAGDDATGGVADAA